MVIARALLVLLAVLCAACEARLTLGARCGYTTECPAGLVCALGRCRDECLTYRDCDIGSTCLLDEATGALACRVPEETGCTTPADCGDGLSCEAGRCAQPCEVTADCAGLVCADGPMGERLCVEPTGTTCVTAADCAYGVCDGGRCDPVRAIVAGLENTCVLLESGRIECAGGNASSVVADDAATTLIPRLTRVQDAFGGAPPLEALALGHTHLCALAAGEVRCWGGGLFGQTGGPTTVTPPVPDPLVGLSGVREIAAGRDLSCARTERELFCWGTDRYGLLGDAAEHPAGPGTDPWRSRPAPVELAGPVRDVDLGYYHACAVALDGNLFCWGANDHSNLGAPDTGERCLATVLPGTPIPCATTPVAVPIVGPAVGRAVAAVTVGVQHTCTLGHEGAVHCWGGNAQGQLGDGTPVGGDVAEARHVLDGAIDVQAGAFHTCALLLDGRVACWGRDAEAELGDGGGGARTTPVYVSGLDDIVAIAIGDSHGCALARTGAVSCWGADFLGQLGDGSMEPAGMRAFTPVPAVVRTGS